MITAIIVISSVALAVLFTIAWLTHPGLRRQIEHPKYSFQDQVQQYDRIYNNEPQDVQDEVKGSSNAP